jgi:hypothetical protein
VAIRGRRGAPDTCSVTRPCAGAGSWTPSTQAKTRRLGAYRALPSKAVSNVRHKKRPSQRGLFYIGAPRFELGTSCPPDKRANQAAPRPVGSAL